MLDGMCLLLYPLNDTLAGALLSLVRWGLAHGQGTKWEMTAAVLCTYRVVNIGWVLLDVSLLEPGLRLWHTNRVIYHHFSCADLHPCTLRCWLTPGGRDRRQMWEWEMAGGSLVCSMIFHIPDSSYCVSEFGVIRVLPTSRSSCTSPSWVMKYCA